MAYRTLKEEWLRLINAVLFSGKSKQVEDYLEARNIQVSFSLSDNIRELLNVENIRTDYEEMHKVFFSDEKNIFGHNYYSSIHTPCEGIKDPLCAMAFLLKKNPNTRKAVLTFSPYGSEKIPCVNIIQFLVRDNVLDIFYSSRGQDIYRKFPCDALCIAEYAEAVSNLTGFPLGAAAGNISSAHIYMEDVSKAENVLSRSNRQIILTSNRKKYSDFESFLAVNGIELLIDKFDFPEIQHADSDRVIEAKAKVAFEYKGFPVWVDDTSLYTEAFPLFPGAYTKYIFRVLSRESLSALFAGRSRRAKMVCRMAQFDGAKTKIVQGESEGILDFSRDVIDPDMPLNSLFIGEGTMLHRKRAVDNLIALLKGNRYA